MRTMKKMRERFKRLTWVWLVVIIVAQTIVYMLAGMSKAYIHMDEAFSLALAQYDKIDIAANEDFYNHWHTKEYYQDYLAVQEDEKWNFSPVYENQKNDVHPPLFYLLLRLMMELSGGEFSKWPGIVLNVVIAAVNTGVMFMVVRELLKGKSNARTKALVLTAVASLTVAAVSAVVYIRMYMLLTLFVMLAVWLHLKLYERKRAGWKLWAGIGLVALGGVLTQYYYLFFLAPLWVVMAVRYGREKRWREFGAYTGVLAVAGVISLVIWPWSVQHMFFGYRGQGVIGSLLNVPGLLMGIWKYIEVLDYNVFHRTLALWAIFVIVFAVFYKLSSDSVSLSSSKESDPAQPENNPQITYKMPRLRLGIWNIVLWPTVVYFLIVAAVSPFVELRYIMPITGLATVLVIAGVYEVVGKVMTEKWRNVVVGGMVVVMIIAAPVQLMTGMMRVELLYRDRQQVMSLVKENPDVPILYFITTENNRFLDNILPFAEAKESYLALDILEPTAQEVKEILRGRDLEQGLIVFVSTSQDVDEALDAVMGATGFTRVDYIQGVNTCDVYFFQ